jgi:NADH-quinone oxidoreductase subunit N
MNAIIFSGIWGVVMMLSGIFIAKRATIKNLAIVGVVLLLLANIAEQYNIRFFTIDLKNMLEITDFGLLFNNISFGATLVYFLLSGKDIEQMSAHAADYFALIFFVLCGIGITACFNTLLMLFLGIEIISIPLYILSGSNKQNLKSNEASLKYFLMGAFSTGIMLLGITLIYGAKGSFAINEMATTTLPGFTPVLTAGLLLLLIAMSFKVSVAPFHFWTPDVYDGTPTVFTSFMATIVKMGVFVAFIRLFDAAYAQTAVQWKWTIIFLIVATLFIGNITAVFQQSVKRMLAYSSIAQAGFMLFALLGFGDTAKEGIIVYAAAYSLATIGIFAILIKMKDYTFDGYNGLAKEEPVLAATNTIFLLSLAGIPLTAGFFAKFYMLQAAIKNGVPIALVIFSVLCAVVSVYYYFKVIQAMYFKEPNQNDEVSGDQIMTTPLSSTFKGLLVLLAAVIILLGLFPQLLLERLYF